MGKQNASKRTIKPVKGFCKDSQLEGRAGIYAIENTFNGHIYIGQSRNLAKRKAQHFTLLKTGKHFNAHLQHSYNFYGPEYFRFVPVEFVDDPKYLDDEEQIWIDNMKPDYNTALEVKNTARGRKQHKLDELIDPNAERFDRPVWHRWVYGGGHNPIHNRG